MAAVARRQAEGRAPTLSHEALGPGAPQSGVVVDRMAWAQGQVVQHPGSWALCQEAVSVERPGGDRSHETCLHSGLPGS